MGLSRTGAGTTGRRHRRPGRGRGGAAPTGQALLLLAGLALLTTGVVGLPVARAHAVAAAPFTATRSYLPLSGSWRFAKGARTDAPQASAYDDSTWSAVTVPHTWNALDGQTGPATYYRGDGWYRRHVTVPSSYAGRRVLVEFGAVNQTAEVWVNGSRAGAHTGGYAKFRLDVTPLVRPGLDNVIAVRVNNAPSSTQAPSRMDYTSFGGIYRDVQLVALAGLQVDALDHAGPGVYVDTPTVSASSATVRVRVRLANRGGTTRSMDVGVELVDPAGGSAGGGSCPASPIAAGATTTCTTSVQVAAPQRWSPEGPALYRARAYVRSGTTLADSVEVTFGIRTFAFSATGGFSVNGTTVRLHGVSRHQDRQDEGWAVSRADEDQDFALMSEMGVNAIRTAHYQMSDHVYDSADRRGLVVWTEVPHIAATPTTEPTYTAYRTNVQTMLVEMLAQLYDHPSIAFVGLGNEQPAASTSANVVPLLTGLDAVVHDTARWGPRVSAYSSNLSDADGSYAVPDVAGFNKYLGWYGGSVGDLGPWLDRTHAAHPTRRLVITEYGAGASTRQHAEQPATSPGSPSSWGVVIKGSPHPEEFQAYLHERQWLQISTRPYVVGSFVWSMFDFASGGRNEGDTPGRNDKGLVTYDRKTRKDAFWFYKSVWTSTPVVHIVGGRFTSRPDALTDVKVYSNAPSVTLTVGGVSQGTRLATQNAQHDVYVWPAVALPSGTATVTAAGGGVSHTVRWSVP